MVLFSDLLAATCELITDEDVPSVPRRLPVDSHY